MITLPIGLVIALASGAALLIVGLFVEARVLRHDLKRMRRDRDRALVEQHLPLAIAEVCSTSDVEEAVRRIRAWRRQANERDQNVTQRRGRGA